MVRNAFGIGLFLFVALAFVGCRNTRVGLSPFGQNLGPGLNFPSDGTPQFTSNSCDSALTASLQKIFPSGSSAAPNSVVVLSLSASGCTGSYRAEGRTFTAQEPLVLERQLGTTNASISILVESLGSSGQVLRSVNTNTISITVSATATAPPSVQAPVLNDIPFTLSPPASTGCRMYQLEPGASGKKIHYLMMVSGVFPSARFNGAPVQLLPIGGNQSIAIAEVTPNDLDVYVAVGEVFSSSDMKTCGSILRLPGCEIEVDEASWDEVVGSVRNIGVTPALPVSINGKNVFAPPLASGDFYDFSVLPTQIGDQELEAEISDLFGNRGSCTADISVPNPEIRINAISARSLVHWPGASPLRAIDQNVGADWNLGTFSSPLSWIEVDLGALYSLSRIRLLVNQLPNGVTHHEVLAGTSQGGPLSGGGLASIATFHGYTYAGQWLERRLTTNPVRYVRVLTHSSPSWVSWAELEFYYCSSDRECP